MSHQNVLTGDVEEGYGPAHVEPIYLIFGIVIFAALLYMLVMRRSKSRAKSRADEKDMFHAVGALMTTADDGPIMTLSGKEASTVASGSTQGQPLLFEHDDLGRRVARGKKEYATERKARAHEENA